MSFIVPVPAASDAASNSSVSGNSGPSAPGGYDPLQHLPTFRSIAAHAIGGAVGGILGGPMGMLGGAALSVVGAFVEAAVAPATATTADVGSTASAAPAATNAPAGPTATPGTSGVSAQAAGQPVGGNTIAAAAGGATANVGDLARRALAALNAYNTTLQSGTAPPGQILA